MRRLLEVLLILTYEHLGAESAIQDSSGNYVPLEKIIANAKSSTHLKLSRDSKAVLEEFRQIGNFSAHKIYYNCRRADLTRIATSYRAHHRRVALQSRDSCLIRVITAGCGIQNCSP